MEDFNSVAYGDCFIRVFDKILCTELVCVCLSVCGEGRRLSVEWFPQPQPVHGAKVHWRDKARQDLIQEIQYCLAKDRNM